MNRCQHCQFDNEPGALFCEQCKSDLGWVEARPVSEELTREFSDSIPAPLPESLPAVDVTVQITDPLMIDDRNTPALLPISDPETDTDDAEPGEAGLCLPQTMDQLGSEETSTPPALKTTPISALGPSSENAIPAGARPKLVVIRGERPNHEYSLYEGDNYIGRTDDKAVDIDLETQEPPDRIWSSRQHAVISFEEGRLHIEDLNSTNGTFVNRKRIESGFKTPLKLGDVIQVGTVQMKLKL